MENDDVRIAIWRRPKCAPVYVRVLDARDPIPRTAEDVAVEALGVRQAVDARELDGVAKAEPSPRPRRRRARAKGAR